MKVEERGADESTRAEHRWYDPRHWEPTGWLLFVTLVGVAFFGIRSISLGRWEDLEKSRQSLRAVIDEPNFGRRFQKAFLSEAALRDCLNARASIADPARLWLGVCLAFQERRDEANDLWKSADWQRCSTEELAQAAMAFFRISDFPRASELIRQALQRTDARELVLRTAIVIDFDLGRTEDVLGYCEELARLAPRDPSPWLTQAAVYEAQSEWPKVVESYRTVLKLTGTNNARYRLVMVSFLLKVGNFAEARQEFERLKRNAPEVLAEEPSLEASLLFAEGKAQEARKSLEAVWPKVSDKADSLTLYGQLLMQIGQPGNAIPHLQKARRLRPADSQILYHLAQAHRRIGEDEIATNLLTRHRNLLAIQNELYALSRTAEADPNNLTARLELIRLYESIGATEDAEFWRRSATILQERQLPAGTNAPSKP
jgi:tetratricopeptide (TPR) repeat protein